MEKYELIKILSRKNKEGNPYYLAIILLTNEYDCDLIRVLVTKEVADKLIKMSDNETFDVSQYLKIQYNTYQKKYVPVIKLQ